MKNVVKKIMLSFMFVLTLAFISGVNVSAASAYETKENMTVAAEEGAVFKLDLEAGGLSKETVYVIHSDTTSLNLKYIERSSGIAAYTSNITVVKCYNISRNKCTNWKGYAVSSVNVDHLRADGFVLHLNGFDGATTITGDVVNGVEIASLGSTYYDLETMIYVLVDYTAVESYWGFGKNAEGKTTLGNHQKVVAQYAQAIPVLNLQEADGRIVVKSDVAADKIDITVETSVRAKSIKYIVTDTDVKFEDIASAKVTTLAEAFTSYAADNGLTVTELNVANDYLEEAIVLDTRKGSAFVTEATIEAESGKKYYVLVEDEVGNQYIRDVSQEGNGNEGVHQQPTNLNPTAPDTRVGKIILIVLVAILVLSAVLVIAQKIFDHKRKLY